MHSKLYNYRFSVGLHIYEMLLYPQDSQGIFVYKEMFWVPPPFYIHNSSTENNEQILLAISNEMLRFVWAGWLELKQDTGDCFLVK